MKNKLTDLNDYLFLQLERLDDEGLKGEDLKAEIDRSKAITGVAEKVIANASLALEAQKFRVDFGGTPHSDMPKMLENS